MQYILFYYTIIKMVYNTNKILVKISIVKLITTMYNKDKAFVLNY